MRRLTSLCTILLLCLLGLPALLAAAEGGDIQWFSHGWCDSSGKDGKGGVSILCSGGKNNLVVRPEDGPGEIDDDTADSHPQWIIYRDADACISFEWTWVTTSTDKFFAKTWAGGGIAFNNSWANIDTTGAKYLVLDAKASEEGLDLGLVLTGDGDTATGAVKLSEYADGRKLGPKWTKVIIPLSSIPNLSKVDPTKMRMIRLDLAGTYPENKHCFVYLDNMYFTAADLVTPVENLGYLEGPDGLTVTWDKAEGEKLEAFVLTLDGRKVGKVGPEKRRAKLPASLLKGKGPFVVGVASANAKLSSSVQAVTVTLVGSKHESATVTVASALGRPVSPYVYGMNGWGLSSKSLKNLGCSVSRWGGNATSSYNWKEDTDNRGSDWYYLNVAKNPKGPESEKQYYQFAQEAFKAGSDVMITIPTIGWVAKAPPSESQRLSSYPLSLFPDQEANDQGAGNGRTKDGKLIYGNDPSLNYVKSDPEFQRGWVETLVKSFGAADKGGVKFYSMDNEPGLWCWTHRDACPQGIGYDDLVDLNAKYGAMVKKVDPNAQIVGFVAWGVKELAGSSWDFMPGGKAGYKLGESAIKDNGWTDRKAHGDVLQVVYYLKEMAKKSKAVGVRLVDYLDNHGFPEVWGTDGKGQKINLLGDWAYDPVLAPKQFDALRILWDPTYVSTDSWCYLPHLRSYLWDPFVGIIPKLKKYIDENYPGTKLAMTEYYPASSHYYHGGLLVAVTLGIFMREGMDLACDWGSTWEGNYVFFGHKIYGNYDGKGSRVGGNYVDSKSSSPDLYSFATKEGSKTCVMLINKNHDEAIDATITLPESAKTLNTYLLSETLGKRIFDVGSQAVSGTTAKVSVPAFSVVLAVIQ